MVLEKGAENQKDGKGEKRGGTQKNRRRKGSMEHHTQKKNNVGWPLSETLQLCGKYNGKSN
jgi:hypothetical protein